MTTSTAAAHVLTTGVLDADDALTLLEQVVSENGRDHEVTNCVYFQALDSPEQAATPVCIVGHVFDKLEKTGFDLTDGIAGMDPMNVDMSSIEVDGLEITPEARDALYEAQMVQDGVRGSDTSWGAALDAARDRHANRRGYALLAAA